MWFRVAVLFAVASCGRIDFDPRADARQPVAWEGTLVGSAAAATQTAMFPIQARGAGDATVVHVGCDSGSPSTPTVSVTAPGWTFVPLGGVAGMALKWAAAFGALAPDTEAATLVVTWNTDCGGIDALGDEFSHTDPTSPFDAMEAATGTTQCAGLVTTASAGDAIWAACTSGGQILATGAGYSMSANDGNDDWSEYKLTTDPAGTAEPSELTTSGAPFVMTTVALRP